MTFHRAENVDDPQRLKKLVEMLNMLDYPTIFPIHPHTKKRIENDGYVIDNSNITITEPVGYLDFLLLLANAKIVFTDSGGIQEEANILHIPCLTLRDNTERPETVEVGSNIVVGVEPANIITTFKNIIKDQEKFEKMSSAPVMYGDGKSAEKIVSIILR